MKISQAWRMLLVVIGIGAGATFLLVEAWAHPETKGVNEPACKEEAEERLRPVPAGKLRKVLAVPMFVRDNELVVDFAAAHVIEVNDLEKSRRKVWADPCPKTQKQQLEMIERATWSLSRSIPLNKGGGPSTVWICGPREGRVRDDGKANGRIQLGDPENKSEDGKEIQVWRVDSRMSGRLPLYPIGPKDIVEPPPPTTGCWVDAPEER